MWSGDWGGAEGKCWKSVDEVVYILAEVDYYSTGVRLVQRIAAAVEPSTA